MIDVNIGEKLALPKGTPRGPDEWPPYPGATKNWSELSWEVVRAVRQKVPGIICSTYEGHGRTGEPWGIDIMVSPFNRRANPEQEQLGDAISDWALANWSGLHINYIIWWNWMNDGESWFSYEPYRKQWSGGSQNLVTSRHMDHVHIQILNPNLGAAQ